jgi:hypothetical protein
MEDLPLMSFKLHRLLVLMLLLACGGGGHSLEGSLTKVMDLKFDKAVLAFSGQEFSVNFEKKKGMGFDTVLTVTTRLEQAPLPDGGMDVLRGNTTYNLAEKLSSDIQRGVVSRNVLDDPRTMFPPLRVGELYIKNVPMQGQNLFSVGSFHVTFEDGVEFASGKTCFTDRFDAEFP